MLKSSPFILLFVLSIANSQFVYNYEEEGQEEPESQNYDAAAYQYNPPSTANQQFAQPIPNNAETSIEDGRRRTRIRVTSRSSNPEYGNSERQQTPVSEPEPDRREAREQRRQARRRQRQRLFVEPTLSPRIYSPSIFENVGLGEAPSGIYIPQDSLLNALRNQPRSVSRQPVSYPVAIVPETSNYVQPPVTLINNEPQQGFFVQPPPHVEPRRTRLTPPVTRYQTEYAASPNPTNAISNSGVQSVPSRAAVTSRQKVRLQSEYAAPPTVDIDSYRNVAREDVMPQVQYVQPLPRSQRRRTPNYQVTNPATRVYSPSVFQNVALGEAPSGVYVPEDSLLNVLRNPSRSTQSRSYRPETNPVPVQQPNYNAPVKYVPEVEYIPEVEYVPEVLAEEEPQALPQPPPQRRRSSQRARQRTSSRRTYDQEQLTAEPALSSSQRHKEDPQDFERQKPPVQHRTQSQRRTASTSMSRPQSQVSSTGSGRREAKLAIAELPLDTDDDGIPGEAGVNYPTLHVIPKTTFSCSQQSHNGYYADLETSCQVVHLCQSGGVQNSFLCPNGTIFSQEKFSCQWWYKVNCSEAPRFYVKNDELYKVPEKKERKRN